MWQHLLGKNQNLIYRKKKQLLDACAIVWRACVLSFTIRITLTSNQNATQKHESSANGIKDILIPPPPAPSQPNQLLLLLSYCVCVFVSYSDDGDGGEWQHSDSG